MWRGVLFLGLLCWSISKLCPSNTTLLHLLALYLLCLVYHLSCVLINSCIFTVLVTEKEDQKTTVGSEILHLTSELNLCLKCLISFFHSDFSFYLILEILVYSVKLDNVCWCAQGLGNSRGRTLDEVKRQGGKSLRWILLLAFRRMESRTICIQWPREDQCERLIVTLQAYYCVLEEMQMHRNNHLCLWLVSKNNLERTHTVNLEPEGGCVFPICRELSGWCWEQDSLSCGAEQGLWPGSGGGQSPCDTTEQVMKLLLGGRGQSQKLHWHQLLKEERDTEVGEARVLEPTVPTRGLTPSCRICKRRFPLSPEAKSGGRAPSELCPRIFLMGGFITTDFTKDSQPQGPLGECYTANSSLTTWKLRGVFWGINIFISQELLHSTGNAARYSVIM